MKQAFLANFPYIELSIIAELLFLTIFLGSIAWVFRRDSKSLYEKMSRIPLDEENNHE